MRSITLAHVGYNYMNSRLIHDQTFAGCPDSLMGCTQRNKPRQESSFEFVSNNESDPQEFDQHVG